MDPKILYVGISLQNVKGDSNIMKMKLLPFTVESQQTTTNEIPYGVHLLEAPSIWEQSDKGDGVVVAILDTGIDRDHPDLKPNIIGGKNFTPEGDSDDYTDRNGHGTHVAGTIAACENGGGVVGVAPKAKLLICKVLDRNGSGGYDAITEGIKYATNWKGPNGERVRILNMSLGGPYNDRKLEKAILQACAKGILVVVASGNEGDNRQDTYEYGYPSYYRECITVAACNEDKELASFSNNHVNVDIIAAGVNVLSTYPSSKYAVLSGTSMATPHVAGALALIVNMGEKAFQKELTESELYALLCKCCCSLNYKKSSEGHGLPELTRLQEEC